MLPTGFEPPITASEGPQTHALGPFSTSVFVAPQIGARLSEPLVTMGVFPRRSASETKARQTLSVACRPYQERHNVDAPQLKVHRRL
jgi:hypothetical protein